ncbi:MAG TPA: DUF1553 domain-containing protein, partial [Bryobacteraceae bacterium]|nr:DUF1553 domain-containing protein [Bryobacteraceae bacterium]
CTFAGNPDHVLAAHGSARREIFERTQKVAAADFRTAGSASLIPASEIPRRSFIDDEIFGKLAAANVPSAALSTDEEFFRRVHFDLTGRLPAAWDVREFLESTDPRKREAIVDKLLDSPEFTDKWTLWFGDLLQNTSVRLATMATPRTAESRNATYAWIRGSVASGKSIHDIAWEAIAASGNTFAADTGAANFILGGTHSMGPRQDSLDLMMVKSATAFLGLAHYDCLSCHSGRGHLDQISLWAKNTSRTDAWRMSAFFARTNWTTHTAAAERNTPIYNSVDVFERPTGTYDLGTTTGNRPARCANALPPDERTGRCLAAGSIAPEYRVTGAKPTGANWRAAFADNAVSDRMFARNFANRLWKAMFNLGLVDPVDTLDPDRLDPKNPPPSPWSLQATHPELLEQLADVFLSNGTHLRPFLRLLVLSSAYQLSSRYDGEWKIDYVPLFARHYPRRLDAEEIHDAIVQATGNLPRYTWALANRDALPVNATIPVSEPVNWAMQLPSTTDGPGFLNTFLRGDRDAQLRSQAGSILQQLALMNDAFVTTRVRMGNSPVLREIAKAQSSDAVVDEIFLTFLSRRPTERERAAALAPLARAANATQRTQAIEDLAWSAINKVDFIFSY